MSTSATVYELKSKTGFYVDRAFWLSAPTETLLTASRIHSTIHDDLEKLDLPGDDRERAWLESLLVYVKNRPDGTFIVITDSVWWNGFDDFEMSIT